MRGCAIYWLLSSPHLGNKRRRKGNRNQTKGKGKEERERTNEGKTKGNAAPSIGSKERESQPAPHTSWLSKEQEKTRNGTERESKSNGKATRKRRGEEGGVGKEEVKEGKEKKRKEKGKGRRRIGKGNKRK